MFLQYSAWRLFVDRYRSLSTKILSIMNQTTFGKTSLGLEKKGQVHCPYDKCLYREGSQRYFKSTKDLNQHIVKVHAEKKFLCEKCRKGFGSEWQQRYHERTCGMEWRCSCGQKYNRRESLLTHHRRTQHSFADNVKMPKWNCSSVKTKHSSTESPMIIVLPVSQTIIYGGQNAFAPQTGLPQVPIVNNTPSHNRLILPKGSAFVLNTNLPSPFVTEPKPMGLNCGTEAKQNKIENHASVETQTVSTATTETQTESQVCLQDLEHSTTFQTTNKKTQTVATTQTNGLPLESRASQCSPRTPSSIRSRRRSYRRTSIETQTVESIVGKIKSSLHSKSRISNKTLKKNSAAQSVWSCLNKLLTSTLSRSSSGTQTSPRGKVHHITCASQTLAQESNLSSEQTAHEMLGLLATVCQHLKDNSMVKGSVVGSPQLPCQKSVNDLKVIVESQDVITDLLQVESLKDVLTDGFSLEETEPLQAVANESRVPLLSNIETQTSTMNCSDYFSSNMETQTTEDTLLSDLELSHIQTQTPWDFLDFCDDSLNANQLSADIQTDITGEDLTDIFEDALWTSNSGTSLADVTDMETQTQCQVPSMELISSYTQTLDNSLQLELPVFKE